MRAADPLRWRGLAKAEQLTVIRRSVEDWCADAGLSDDLTLAVSLAVYEAMANVVEHAYRDGGPGSLDLELRHEGDAVTASVGDEGHWHVTTPDEQRHRGRGLALIQRLAGQVSVMPSPAGTTVRMRWPLATGRLRFLDAMADTGLARLDTDVVLRELLTRVRDLLPVDMASVLLYDRSGDHLVAAVSTGLEITTPVRIPASEGLVGRVVAELTPIVDDDEALVPMIVGGALVGVLRVGTDRRLSADELDLLQIAADRFALAVQARASNAETTATTALQRSLLPSRLPSVAGLDLAGRYAPGAELGVGGDWYDVFTLSDGRLGIVIGDVAGHGFPAAVVMGRLRSALRAYALDNNAPEVVLDKLDRKASHFETGVMATVAYAVVDPTASRLTLCLAGHLRPVLAVPGRPSVFIEAAVDPPIGFALRDRGRRSHVVDIPPGATVCFYTDGLIERRDRPIDVGLSELLAAVAAVPSESVCAELMTEFVEGQATADDVALLVMHRTEGSVSP